MIGIWNACLSTSAGVRERRSRLATGELSHVHPLRGSGLEFAYHGGYLQRRTHGSTKETLGPEVPWKETRNTIARGDPVLVPVRPPDLAPVPVLFRVRVLRTRHCYSPAKDLQKNILEPRNEAARALNRVVVPPSTIYGDVADEGHREVRVGAGGPGAALTDIQPYLQRMWHMSRALSPR